MMGSTATIAPKFIYATAIFSIDTPNPRRMVDGLERQIGAIDMIKFWIEWLDGTLAGSIEAQNERSALNLACTLMGYDNKDIRIRKANQS